MVDMIISGLELVDTEWDELKYCPKTWSDDENKRPRGAPPMHKKNLDIFKEKANRPYAYNTHLKNQPAFEASDVASETSTASSICSKTDLAHLDAFTTASNAVWDMETKASMPKVAARAKAAKPDAKSLGIKMGKSIREKRGRVKSL